MGAAVAPWLVHVALLASQIILAAHVFVVKSLCAGVDDEDRDAEMEEGAVRKFHPFTISSARALMAMPLVAALGWKTGAVTLKPTFRSWREVATVRCPACCAMTSSAARCVVLRAAR